MKLYELPVGTVVDFEGEGYYEKRDNGDWYAVTGHCVDCMDDDFIKADSIVEDDVVASCSINDKPSRGYKIISMPFDIVLQLAINLADEYDNYDGEGNPITINGIIRDAIEEDRRQKDLKRAAGIKNA